MKMTFVITPKIVTDVLKTVDQGLVSGLGLPKPGSMCVEAAVCYALGLPHNDDPGCVDPAIRSLKIRLNDSGWSSPALRAAGLRRLAILQLGTKGLFDSRLFSQKVALFTINVILADCLQKIGLLKEAEDCRQARSLAAAKAATWAAAGAVEAAAGAAAEAAAWAVEAAAWAAAGAAEAAAWAAAGAAEAAAKAAGADAGLQKFADGVADILIEMEVPATRYLYLLEK
jgi:hypothetical protein